jgi:hypothetical protein
VRFIDPSDGNGVKIRPNDSGAGACLFYFRDELDWAKRGPSGKEVSRRGSGFSVGAEFRFGPRNFGFFNFATLCGDDFVENGH